MIERAIAAGFGGVSRGAAGIRRECAGSAGTDLAAEFAVFDRYERRARSRRKFAVRAFDAARQRA